VISYRRALSNLLIILGAALLFSAGGIIYEAMAWELRIAALLIIIAAALFVVAAKIDDRFE
jgi:hypothetical protein